MSQDKTRNLGYSHYSNKTKWPPTTEVSGSNQLEAFWLYEVSEIFFTCNTKPISKNQIPLKVIHLFRYLPPPLVSNYAPSVNGKTHHSLVSPRHSSSFSKCRKSSKTKRGLGKYPETSSIQWKNALFLNKIIQYTIMRQLLGNIYLYRFSRPT